MGKIEESERVNVFSNSSPPSYLYKTTTLKSVQSTVKPYYNQNDRGSRNDATYREDA